MTRKDYIAIAAALKTASMSRPHVVSASGAICHAGRGDQLTWFACVTEITAVLARDNPRFDTSRFHDACGVPS